MLHCNKCNLEPKANPFLYVLGGFFKVLTTPPRGGKSGRFREFNSQKIFSKTRFDRKYLGKYHDIRSFANKNSSVMLNLSRQLKKMPFSIVFILSLRLKPCQNLEKLAENI